MQHCNLVINISRTLFELKLWEKDRTEKRHVSLTFYYISYVHWMKLSVTLLMISQYKQLTVNVNYLYLIRQCGMSACVTFYVTYQ